MPGLALGLTAFLAVIREGAETIVFFQALTVGATASFEKHAVMAGIAAATAGLAITFFVLNRAAHRIPFGKFFYATSILLYALAVVFIGQGIASFQESAVDQRDLRRLRPDDSDARPVSDGAEHRRAVGADRIRGRSDDHSAWLGGKGGSGSFGASGSPDLICGGRASTPPSPITIS